MKIPTKKILWAQVFAGLFAAIMAIICFFTPLTTLKANGNVGDLFTEYVATAAIVQAKDADADELQKLEKEFDVYGKMLDDAKTLDEDGNFKGMKVKTSVSGLLFNLVNTVKVFIRVGQIDNLNDMIERLPDAEGSSRTALEASILEAQKKLAEADFKELNATSLGFAYYLTSFTMESAVEGVSTSSNGMEMFAKVIGLVFNIFILLAVLVMYAIAVIKAILLLIGMASHFSAPEGYYEKATKRSANLISTVLFATFLALITSNGGGLAAGGVLLLVTSILVIGVNVAAMYLKNNSPAQLKYLITSHIVGAISVVGIVLAFIGTMSAGLGDWLIGNEAGTLIREIAWKESTAEKQLATYTSLSGIAMYINIFSLVLNLVFVSYLLKVFINSALLTEGKQSVKNKPGVIAVSTLVIVFLPFIITKAVIGISVPGAMMGALVLSWLGAVIFAVAQFGKDWAYGKFTNISITEKALLLAGFPDGEQNVAAPVEAAPAVEEAPVEAPAEVAATEETPSEEA